MVDINSELGRAQPIHMVIFLAPVILLGFVSRKSAELTPCVERLIALIDTVRSEIDCETKAVAILHTEALRFVV
jgi:hypothetical protein